MEKNRDLEFLELTENQFYSFSTLHPQASFMQTVQLANLKKELGDEIHFLGVREKGKIIAATLILEEPSILGMKSFYAPRGYLIDYCDLELLKFFSDSIEDYAKKRKGFRIIIDPNVIYQIRNSDGEEIDNDKNDEVILNLTSIGYKHFGFNLYLEALQMRWEYRLRLDKTYDEIKSNYSKSTRKNIDNCYKKGLRVREGKIEHLQVLVNIFEETSIRKEFNSRSLEYYKKMYKHMSDLMKIYIAHIDPDVYCECSMNNLKEEKDNNLNIQNKMKTSLIGNKLKNQKETSDKLIEKYEEELRKSEEFKTKYPDGKDIGVLLSMKSGDEYLTLNSGMLAEYKAFTPKYAMYDQHVKDAIKEKYKWVDFYGITGCFDKDDKYYGIYEFKKGFNGNVVELIGQFEKKISSFYYIYDFLRKTKKIAIELKSKIKKL